MSDKAHSGNGKAHSLSEKVHAESDKKHVEYEDDRSEPEIDEGDEDVFEGYFLSKSGINLNYLLFPGLIVHEFAHYIVCKLAGVYVHEVVWWSAKGGHVVHQRANPANSVLISLAPFFLNNMLAILLLGMAAGDLNAGSSATALLYFWLGFSLAVYSIPSAHDLKMSLYALHRGYRKHKANAGIAWRLMGFIIYPIWFALQYALVIILMPIAKNRTLRIGWALIMVLFLSTSAAAVLLR